MQQFAVQHIENARAALVAADFDCVAQVLDSDRATDLAIALSPPRLAVVRCVKHASMEDHTALATMLTQGDFIWGAIVYSESAEPDPLDLIEGFHVDAMDQLVARLLEVREALP